MDTRSEASGQYFWLIGGHEHLWPEGQREKKLFNIQQFHNKKIYSSYLIIIKIKVPRLQHIIHFQYYADTCDWNWPIDRCISSFNSLHSSSFPLSTGVWSLAAEICSHPLSCWNYSMPWGKQNSKLKHKFMKTNLLKLHFLPRVWKCLHRTPHLDCKRSNQITGGWIGNHTNTHKHSLVLVC